MLQAKIIYYKSLFKKEAQKRDECKIYLYIISNL